MSTDSERLERILALQQSGLDPSVLLATQGGLSRTDLNALLGAGLGVGAGVISPESLEMQALLNLEAEQAAAQEAYDQAVREAQAGLGREPTFASYAPLTLMVEANVASQAAGFSEEEKALINLAINAVTQGADPEITAASLRSSMGGSRTRDGRTVFDDLSDEGERVLAQVANSLEGIQKETSDYQAARRDYDDAKFLINQQVAAMEPAKIDAMQSFRDFYSDAGVPAMGYLPSPSDRYQVDYNQLFGTEGDAERRRKVLSDAVKAEADQRQGVLDALGAKDTPVQTPTRAVDRLREFDEGEAALNRLVSQQLAARGRTPFSDAQKELLRYGLIEAR